MKKWNECDGADEGDGEIDSGDVEGCERDGKRRI